MEEGGPVSPRDVAVKISRLCRKISFVLFVVSNINASGLAQFKLLKSHSPAIFGQGGLDSTYEFENLLRHP